MTRRDSPRAAAIVGAFWLLVACGAHDRTTAGDSTRADAQSPASVAGASATGSVGLQPSDHAVYSALLRQNFLQPQRGEHELLCAPTGPDDSLAIVGTTQPLPIGTPRRDSLWAAELPEQAAPLMAELRALDREPGRALVAGSLALGMPIRLIPDSIAARMLRATDERAARRTPDAQEISDAPSLFWVSRVVYSADRSWALVHAVQVCPGATTAMVADAENGAYERVIVAPLQWRDGAWTAHSPLFLDVGLPRLEPRPGSRP